MPRPRWFGRFALHASRQFEWNFSNAHRSVIEQQQCRRLRVNVGWNGWTQCRLDPPPRTAKSTTTPVRVASRVAWFDHDRRKEKWNRPPRNQRGDDEECGDRNRQHDGRDDEGVVPVQNRRGSSPCADSTRSRGATILSWSICASSLFMAAPSIPAGDIPTTPTNNAAIPRDSLFRDAAGSARGAFDARLSDLSVSGCYIVNRRTTPSIGEIVEIDVVRTAQEPLPLAGEVVSTEPGIGRRPVCWGR